MLNRSSRKKLRALVRPFKNAAGIMEASLTHLLYESKCEHARLSFCTTVMNRFDHLQKTLQKNIEDNIDYDNCEFVILNYNCPDPRTKNLMVKQLYNYIENKRLKYFYYPDAKYYNMSHSRNMVFRLATGDILCSIDADNYIGKGFAHYINLAMRNGNVFLRGPSDGRGLGGRICIKKQHFLKVGGYDERFVGWGEEDKDIANRLQLLGVKRKIIYAEKFLKSIQHPRNIRVQQFPEDKKIPIESRIANEEITESNLKMNNINPNGDQLGMGRVRNLNGRWQTLGKL